MKTTQVTVRFPQGLHARPAAGLVRLFKSFHSKVRLRLGSRAASAGSVTSILLLGATLNAQLEVQASGEDEDAAIQAVEVFFQNADENVTDKKTLAGDELERRVPQDREIYWRKIERAITDTQIKDQ